MRRKGYILLALAALVAGWVVLKDHLDSSQISALGGRLSEMMVRKAFAKVGGYQINLKLVVFGGSWMVGLAVVLLWPRRLKRQKQSRIRLDREEADVFHKDSLPLSIHDETASEGKQDIGHSLEGSVRRQVGNPPGL
jgi:hypothetical protein